MDVSGGPPCFDRQDESDSRGFRSPNDLEGEGRTCMCVNVCVRSGDSDGCSDR